MPKNTGASSTPKNLKGRTFLQKRAFLSDDKEDNSVVMSNVRTFDYGGSNAEFRIINHDRSVSAIGDGAGFSIYCSLANKESVARVNKEIDNIIASLNEFKKAVNVGSKEAQKMMVEG